jgi:arylsulfatase A-like enzyme
MTTTNSAPPTRSGRVQELLTHLTLWVAAATLAAFLQLGGARILNLGFSIHRWGWDSRDLIWQTPLAYALIFAPVAIGLAILGTIVAPRTGRRLALWTWSTLVLFAFLLLFPQIHGYASLLLASGAALSLSALMRRRWPGTLRAARLLAAGMVVPVTLAFLLPRSRAATESRAIAALPPALAGAPNVLLLILDTVRADYMSLYGAELPTTPNLERWGQKAVVFDESYSTAPWTTPSHASLFTGQFPSIHKATYTRALAAENRTLAEVLSEHGWATGGFTANIVAARASSGLSQGFVRYEDFKVTFEELLKSTTITQADNVLLAWLAIERGVGPRTALRRFVSSDFTPHFTPQAHDEKSGAEVRESFLRWSDRLPAGRPFFAFLNFMDAHSPYRPPEPYYSMFRRQPQSVDRYRGGIRYIDEQIDQLLRALESRGKLANTIVVITADHGEQWGEHGQVAHGNSLYRQLLHVPLLIMYPPKVPVGVRVRRQVTGRDIPATILELAGIPRDSAIGGVSLAALWRDGTARGSDVVAEVDQNSRPMDTFANWYGPMKAIVDDTLHVIRRGDGTFEAYAYRSDPAEERELVAARGDSLPFQRLLHQVVARYKLTWPRPRPRMKGRELDPSLVDQ